MSLKKMETELFNACILYGGYVYNVLVQGSMTSVYIIDNWKLVVAEESTNSCAKVFNRQKRFN